MAARFVEETESGKDGSDTEPVITAGVNRLGKKRLSPLADSEISETPTAGSLRIICLVTSLWEQLARQKTV